VSVVLDQVGDIAKSSAFGRTSETSRGGGGHVRKIARGLVLLVEAGRDVLGAARSERLKENYD
jgi:hypothetical protein